MAIEADSGEIREAYAYTPGLTVKSSLTVRRTRRLPIEGEVLVKEGDVVSFDTIVARTYSPGYPQLVPVSEALNVLEEEVPRYLVKKVGDRVSEGEAIAVKSSLFGLSKNRVLSPCNGVIEEVSEFTGQVVVREPDIRVEIKAYIPGRVVEVLPKTGVVIETRAAFIQGIFGVGGENHGELLVLSETSKDILTAERITPQHKGKILVAGAAVTNDAVRKANEVGAACVISGGIESLDLTDLLGYEIGVAITGQEELGITLIITEGWGKMSISDEILSLLKNFNGSQAAVNGATQIRAGVLRPEIIIPHLQQDGETSQARLESGMRIGTPVRIIRGSYFGDIGVVVDLPVSLQEIETESSVRVVEVVLKNGQRVVLPRTNVEIMEK